MKILTGVLVHRVTRPLRGSVSCGSGWSVSPCVSIQLPLGSTLKHEGRYRGAPWGSRGSRPSSSVRGWGEKTWVQSCAHRGSPRPAELAFVIGFCLTLVDWRTRSRRSMASAHPPDPCKCDLHGPDGQCITHCARSQAAPNFTGGCCIVCPSRFFPCMHTVRVQGPPRRSTVLTGRPAGHTIYRFTPATRPVDRLEGGAKCGCLHF